MQLAPMQGLSQHTPTSHHQKPPQHRRLPTCRAGKQVQAPLCACDECWSAQWRRFGSVLCLPAGCWHPGFKRCPKPCPACLLSPGRMVPASGGVLIVLPLRTKMLQLDTSSRYVSVFASRYTTSANKGVGVWDARGVGVWDARQVGVWELQGVARVGVCPGRNSDQMQKQPVSANV